MTYASAQTKQVKSIIGAAFIRDVRVKSDVAGTMISSPSQVVLAKISEALQSRGFDVLWFGNNMISAAK